MEGLGQVGISCGHVECVGIQLQLSSKFLGGQKGLVSIIQPRSSGLGGSMAPAGV